MKKAKRKAQRALAVFVLAFLFYGFLYSYAIAKFIMLFICEDAVWNVTGCVVLAEDY